MKSSGRFFGRLFGQPSILLHFTLVDFFFNRFIVPFATSLKLLRFISHFSKFSIFLLQNILFVCRFFLSSFRYLYFNGVVVQSSVVQSQCILQTNLLNCILVEFQIKIKNLSVDHSTTRLLAHHNTMWVGTLYLVNKIQTLNPLTSFISTKAKAFRRTFGMRTDLTVPAVLKNSVKVSRVVE